MRPVLRIIDRDNWTFVSRAESNALLRPPSAYRGIPGPFAGEPFLAVIAPVQMSGEEVARIVNQETNAALGRDGSG